MERVFDELVKVNVNEYTEVKNAGGIELTYLSWPFAWQEVKKRYPNAKYEIWKNENGLPYAYDERTGYMVYTSVTIDDITHEMWLPVMDGSNKAMKAEPYEYTTKYYGKETTKKVAAATMFDINKTVMRCLVKNLAMFGLGLYIYAGEDLPEGEEPKTEESKKTESKKTTSKEEAHKVVEELKQPSEVPGYPSREELLIFVKKYYPDGSKPLADLLKFWNLEKLEDANTAQLATVYKRYSK